MSYLKACRALAASSGFVLAFCAAPIAAHAQASFNFDIPSQPLAQSLRAIGSRAGVNVAFNPQVVQTRQGHALKGVYSAQEALSRVVAGQGLAVRTTTGGTFLVEPSMTSEAQAAAAPRIIAASTADRTVEASASEPFTGLDEVVVTAERRSTRLQETPLALTALSSEALESQNVRSTRDLVQVTPGLQVATPTAGVGAGSATYFLRGMGQQRSGNGTSTAVGIYLDDFYYPVIHGTVFNILDLEQVEVLRGPQGTLFGRNTIGGAIRYITKKPEFTTSGYVQATAGSYDRRDIVASVNLPLGDDVAVRFTAGSLSQDGYVKQASGQPDAAASSTKLLRAQLRYMPTSDLDVLVAAQYSRSEADGFAYVLPGPIITRPNSLPAAWNASAAGQARPFDDRYVSQCDYCQAGTTKGEFSETEFKSANAIVKWQATDGITVKSLTGVQEVETDFLVDIDGTPLPINDGVGSFVAKVFSQELQINGTAVDGRINWVSGLYYYDESQQDNMPKAGLQISNGRLLQPTLLRSANITKAAFVDATASLTDKIKILGGVRYSVDEKEAAIRSTAGALLVSGAKDFPSTTWRLGALAQWTDAIMTYATISRGFRSGGFVSVSTTGNQLDPFEPEAATNYELGARMELFNRRLRINPTVFYTKWDDIQIQETVSTPFGANFFVENAAEAESRGLEVEGQMLLTEGLRVFGSLSLLDIGYLETGTLRSITVNSKFAHAPKMTHALGASYKRTLESGVRLATTVNWSWQDERYSTAGDTSQLRLPSYGLLNARLDLTDPSDLWTLAVFATNITDEVYYVGGVDYSFTGTGTRHFDLGRPREVGASLRYSF